jgi:hypothetical protein
MFRSGLAAITTPARRHKLANSQQQSLLTTHLSFSNRLHSPQLLLSQIKAPSIL